MSLIVWCVAREFRALLQAPCGQHPRQAAAGQMQREVDEERGRRVAVDHEDLDEAAHRLVDPEHNAMLHGPNHALDGKAVAAAAAATVASEVAADVQKVHVVVQRLHKTYTGTRID